MSKNKDIVDLMSENLMFEEREQTIKLLKFNKSTMNLDIAIFEKEIGRASCRERV